MINPTIIIIFPHVLRIFSILLFNILILLKGYKYPKGIKKNKYK